MRPEFQLREWTYVLGGPLLQRQNWPALASVAPGAQITKLPLRLDTDAPFLLRSIAVRVQYDPNFPLGGSTHRQTGLNFVLFRFTGPTGQYFQQVPTPLTLMTPYGGQIGNPLPMQRQVYYPAGGLIQLDLVNSSTAQSFTNLTFYFKGVKIWPWGVRRWYPYPSRVSMLPYAYTFGQSPIEFPTLYNVATTQPVGTPLRVTLNFKEDGDFVLRSMQAGPANNLSWEVFLRLKDSDEYPYSSDFVHADVMCGHGLGTATYPTGSPTGGTGGSGVVMADVQAGGALPAVVFPEIYVPNNHYMWLEIARADAPFVVQGAIAQDFPIVFRGAKVYQAG